MVQITEIEEVEQVSERKAKAQRQKRIRGADPLD